METLLTKTVKNEVLKYIQQHLSGNLSLDRLSEFSGYSSFHLHRMMKEELHEPLGQYIKRKRIETAAMLLGLTKYRIADIKGLVGYENDAAFSKAFVRIIGCSPRAFRKRNFFSNTYADLPGEYLSLDYRIIKLKDWQAIAFPSICNYFDKSLFKSWAPVKEFIDKDNIDIAGLHYWGVLHECPNITGKTNGRYDAAISPASGILLKDQFNTKYLGGKFAVFTFCAPHDRLKDITLRISDYVMHETKLEFREGSSYFQYRQNPISSSPDYLLTEWYVPVK